MTTNSVSAPFPIFTDTDGDPLDLGYVYIGQPNQDAQTSPKSAYWDAALTSPAAQPIRTRGGYPVNNGTPARIYVDGDYSIKVNNRNGTLIYNAPTRTNRIDGGLISSVGSDVVTYTPSGTGAVATTVQSKLRETVSVTDYYANGVSGAKVDPTGVIDSTAGIQAALTYYGTLVAGDTSAAAGYVGDTLPELLFPAGTYLCGEVNMPSRIRIRCEGRAVIKSLTGTSATPAGYWSNDVVVNGEIDGLSFLYFDTVLRWQTNNADISFHTLRNVTAAKCNKLLDQVSYAASRSTTTLLDRLRVGYGVPQVARIYSDKSTVQNSWLVHDADSYLFFIDSFCSFKNNVLVPVGTGTSRAVIWWEASDQARSLLVEDMRFGGEAGQAPIAVIGNVNTTTNASDVYRNQGITFRRCELNSNKSYNPDGITAVDANVILRPTVAGGNKAIQFIKFEECYAGPDKSGGIVQYYGSSDVTTLLPSDFTIELDSSSLRSFIRGVNKPTSDVLARYLSYDQINRKVTGIRGPSGRIVPIDTATAGQKKITFSVDLSFPETYHTPVAFLVSLTGQGTSTNNSTAYGCVSVYIVTIQGFYDTSVKSKITYTKLHGNVMGIGGAMNADIVSAHFGTGDTGSNLYSLINSPGANAAVDVTIAFGTGISQLGACFVRPLFDFGLST